MQTLVLLVALGTAEAGDPIAAEATRLFESMQSLSERDAYRGVDQKYRALLALDTAVPGEAHRMGADASRALGEAAERQARLARAEAAGDTQATTELAQLSASWGTTYLLGRADLLLEPVPFAPDQRAALDFAQQELRQDGRFYGLLPVGSYRFSDGEGWGQTFTLSAGVPAALHYGETSVPLADPFGPVQREGGYHFNELAIDRSAAFAVVSSHPEAARVLARARTANIVGLSLLAGGLGGLLTAAALPGGGAATGLLFTLPSLGAIGVGGPLLVHGLTGRRRALERYNKAVAR